MIHPNNGELCLVTGDEHFGYKPTFGKLIELKETSYSPVEVDGRVYDILNYHISMPFSVDRLGRQIKVGDRLLVPNNNKDWDVVAVEKLWADPEHEGYGSYVFPITVRPVNPNWNGNDRRAYKYFRTYKALILDEGGIAWLRGE